MSGMTIILIGLIIMCFATIASVIVEIYLQKKKKELKEQIYHI